MAWHWRLTAEPAHARFREQPRVIARQYEQSGATVFIFGVESMPAHILVNAGDGDQAQLQTNASFLKSGP
jgi:hypothetical protein